MDNLVISLLSQSEMDTLQARMSVDIARSVHQIRIRVNIFNSIRGLSLAIRLLPGTVPNIRKLNLHPSLSDYCKAPSGLILVCGATGSGKSSTMAAVIEAQRKSKKRVIDTGTAYDAYHAFCSKASVRPLTGRVFGDLLGELDLYCLLRSRIISRGRYGRTREIVIDLSEELIERIYATLLRNFNLK